MNEIINYFVKSISNSSLTLKKKSILVEKPWALVDDDGAVQKLIFKKNGGLILSKNGKVTDGSWEYFAEAKSLLINRIDDKLLLSEQFIEDNVLIFKKDGTENQFYSFANENVIKDYNIIKYLNTLKCKQFGISERRLLSGNLLHIYPQQSGYISIGCKVEQIDQTYNTIDIPDGKYITEDKISSYYINEGRVSAITSNLLVKAESGLTIEIENGESFISDFYILNNIGKKVTMNGTALQEQRYLINDRIIFEIRESRIKRMYFRFSYELKNGNKILLEQQSYSQISKGDKIIEAEPIYPLPNGSYKVKGRFFKINVADNTIV